MKAGRLVVGSALVLALTSIVMYFVLGETRRLVDDWVIHNVVATSMFAVVVWLALPGGPQNRALWTLTWASAFGALTAFGAALGLAVTGIAAGDIDAELVTVAPAELELAGAIGFVLAQALWVPSLFLILTLGLLLFPDGAFPSLRWRWVGWFAGLSITALTSYFAWGARPWSDSPYITSDAELLELFPSIVLPMVVVATVASLVGLVLRCRRSTGELRQQFRWVTWGFSILAVLTATLMPTNIDLFQIVSLPAIALVGVTYGVAITKYRLYEIAIVLNRSLVFAVLAGFITGVYAVIVVGLGSWIGAGTSSLPLSMAATAVVAVAFEPVRHWVQRIANRLVYGSRATPYQVLADLTARLASAESTDGLLERMVRRLAEGTGAVRASLRLEGEDLPTAVWPPDADEAGAGDGEFTVPIAGGERVLGSLSVLKTRGESLTPTEQGLVEDLAGSAAMVLNKVRLDTDFAARAEELRLSRRRLVDDQRRRLERDLHDGAQQQIVALKVKLGLAVRFADQESSEGIARLITQMAEDSQAAIEEIRSLAKGIFPPLLESEGLESVVTAGAANASIPVIVDASDLDRYDIDVEAAAYFCISEAITNAVKHSQAGRIDVELRKGEKGLEFVVGDNGDGFGAAQFSEGSGLVGMRDRLEALGGSLSVTSSPGGGSRIEGFVPAVPVG